MRQQGQDGRAKNSVRRQREQQKQSPARNDVRLRTIILYLQAVFTRLHNSLVQIMAATQKMIPDGTRQEGETANE